GDAVGRDRKRFAAGVEWLGCDVLNYRTEGGRPEALLRPDLPAPPNLPHPPLPPDLPCQYVTRTRYFRTAVPSGATGTENCAAHAEVLVHVCDDRCIRQVPPIGSWTSTDTGAPLWLRRAISYSTSYT